MENKNEKLSAFQLSKGEMAKAVDEFKKEAKVVIEKHKEKKIENKNAVNRMARLARMLIKYWRAIAAFTAFALVLVILFGFNIPDISSFFVALNPLPLLKEFVNFFFAWAIVIIVVSVIFTTSWRSWFGPKEKTFDSIWIEKLGIAFELKPKKSNETHEQYIEELLTDVAKEFIEDERYKGLVFKGEHKRNFRHKLFNQDIMRKEARMYYEQHYLPIMMAKEKGKQIKLETATQEEVIINEQGFIQ